MYDSIQTLGVDYRILIRICGFNEILIKTLLAPATIFGRLCFQLRAIEFYQISADFFEFLVEFCCSERVVCGGASPLMPAVCQFLAQPNPKLWRVINFPFVTSF